jgi:hypothetical protein
VRNGLLQPGQDSRGVAERFFRQEAVDFVAQADLDAAVPQPADADVDFAVGDPLHFRGRDSCVRLWRMLHYPLKGRELIGSPGWQPACGLGS